MDLLWVTLVNDDRGLITTPAVIPLKNKADQRKFHNTQSTGSPNGWLGVRTVVGGGTYPTLGRTLSVVSLLVSITTVHLRVSTVGEGRIRHVLVVARRRGRRGSVLGWWGTI